MKNGISLFFILTIVLSLMMFSCKDRVGNNSKIITEINGHKLTEEQFLEFCGIKSIDDISESEIRAKIDEWIKIVLLAEEADKKGISSNTRIQFRVNMAADIIKANALLAHEVNNIDLTENDLFNYYQIHKNSYIKDVQEYRIQRILLASETLADSVSSLLINQELSFAEAARQFSDERFRESEGYIGYLSLEEMSPPIRAAVSNLSQWRFTRIPASNGYYLIRYTDIRNRKIEKSFTEVIDEVRDNLLEERKSDIVNNLVNKLINQAEITITR